MTILLAAGDCFSAFLLGPVLAELRARGVAFRLVAAATERELTGLRTVLGPDAELRGVTSVDQAAAFAREIIQPGLSVVVTVGTSWCTRTFTRIAEHHDVRTVHLDGGVRAYGIARQREPEADLHCVTGDIERSALLQDGCNPNAVTIIGDLVATAVLASARATAVAGLAIVWEHLAFADDDTAARTTERLTASWAPSDWPRSPPPPRESPPSAWIDFVANARVLATDSVAWQRVAVALGVPCVALASELWTPGVAAGLVTGSDGTDATVAAAVRRLASQSRRAPELPDGVARRIVDAVLLAPATPAVNIPLPSDGDASGRTFSNDEAALVAMVLQRGTLNSTRGTMVTTFERRFAQWLGRKHAIACASGSAAVHCTVAALQLQPGDEVITTPITDMGALTPILYEGAVPVFADVDPRTLNVTAATIEAQLTERTRAIVVTHLFGLPADLDAIGELAAARGIPLIEDAAQAFGATWRNRRIGTFGKLAAFSLQQGKHITAGEGGIVATDDDALARRVFLYVNKAWGYGDKQPDHYFPALNYRLTELQGAVLVAQLPKLDGVVDARRAVAASLRRALAGVPGLQLPDDPAHGTHSYWKFAFFVDDRVVPGGAVALGKQMQQAGIACVPRYIQKPAFECELFRDWRRSPVTWLPLQHNPRRDRATGMFARADYPGAVDGLEHVVVLPINERYTEAHVAHVAARIRAAVGALQHA